MNESINVRVRLRAERTHKTSSLPLIPSLDWTDGRSRSKYWKIGVRLFMRLAKIDFFELRFQRQVRSRISPSVTERLLLAVFVVMTDRPSLGLLSSVATLIISESSSGFDWRVDVRLSARFLRCWRWTVTRRTAWYEFECCVRMKDKTCFLFCQWITVLEKPSISN